MRARGMHGRVPAAVAAVLSCTISGCVFHKKVQPQPVILARQTTVALDTPPAVANPPLLEAPNQTKLPAVPVAEAATKPKRVRRRPKQSATAAQTSAPATATPAGPSTPGQPPTTAPPVQVAVNTPPPSPAQPSPDTVIGALTPGGVDQSPQVRQEAQELLSSTDHRLSALPGSMQQSQKSQISQIRNFWKQGSDALKAGDAEGAKTLALKAKLLLDDLEKAGQ